MCQLLSGQAATVGSLKASKPRTSSGAFFMPATGSEGGSMSALPTPTVLTAEDDPMAQEFHQVISLQEW